MASQKKSFAEATAKAQLMVSGLKSKASEVEKRGIDNAFITELETLRTEIITKNDEQERLKAQLKTATEELDKKMTLLQSKMSEARKLVKLTIPQSGWLEFGIEDKK